MSVWEIDSPGAPPGDPPPRPPIIDWRADMSRWTLAGRDSSKGNFKLPGMAPPCPPSIFIIELISGDVSSLEMDGRAFRRTGHATRCSATRTTHRLHAPLHGSHL